MGLLTRLFGERRGWRLSSASHPRDPVLAQIFGGSATTNAGVSVTPDNARSCPEVDACIGLNEDTLGTVPVDFYERTGEGAREKRDDHPLHVLVHDRPNSWQTSAEFRQMMEGWRETHGNAYARIIGGGAFPEALEPVHPNEMRPQRLSTGAVAYRWSPPASAPVTLLQSEVLHLRDRPAKRFNLIEGESRVERHRETIGRAIATGDYLSRFFSNGAVPKTFLVLPSGQNLGEDTSRLLLEQFEKRHGGNENQHRIGLLQGGLDIKSLGVDNEKSQVIDAYRMVVAQIARIWGVPLHLIGELTGSTSWGTGIEQQSIGFVSYFMRPKFVVWEQALNQALMSLEMGRKFFFEFNIDGLLRGDFKSRMDGYAVMIQWGLATPNEIRRLMNLPAMEGGDDRLSPLNMVPATRIMDVLLKPSSGQQMRDADAATGVLAGIVRAANGHAENVQ